MRLLIDCDAGIDDAHAILMALAEPAASVVAITTVHGNALTEQVTKNVLRVLKVSGRLQIPVYMGARQALLGGNGDSSHYHGNDGFGDAPDPEKPDVTLVKSEHAVAAIIRLVSENPGELTLVCLGPLTNIALAIRLDPSLGGKLRSCYIMGGNYEGKGNVTPSAEFNFHTDPEAAQIVLNDLGCHITMACWELCVKHFLPLDEYHRLRAKDTAKARFMRHIEARVIQQAEKVNLPYQPCDELTMTVVLDPKVIKYSTSVYATVETSRGMTRGQVVVDWAGTLGNTANVTLITELNTDLFVKRLESAMD